MYVEKLFTADENLQLRLRLHWVKYIGAVLLFIFSLLLCFIALTGGGEDVDARSMVYSFALVAFVFGGYYWLKNVTTEMVVTNHRVISKSGIIAVHLGELRNMKVETIRIHQSILGRILGYGDIELTGTGNSFVVFECVANPSVTMSKIKSIIDQYKDVSNSLS